MGSMKSVHDGLAIINAGIEAVQADRLIQTSGCLNALGADIETAERVFVVGAGKASLVMASMVEAAFGDEITSGVVTVPHGYVGTLPERCAMPSRIKVLEAGHPIPDHHGVAAAGQALELAVACTEKDLLLVLISGGSSALWSGYAPGISLEDAAETTKLLLKSGALIQDMNIVRKHISSIAGGRLLEVAAPATVRALVISDVVGDDVSFIGSGPCSPDATTYSDAILVINELGLESRLPESVHRHLHLGADGLKPEPPKPGSIHDEKTDVHLIGTNKTALDAMALAAGDSGYEIESVMYELTGEARTIGVEVARATAQLPPGSCIIWGGETTVTVTGPGSGGRNHELALAAAIELESLAAVGAVLSAGTDGIDGLTTAAGAWADFRTVERGRSFGVDARSALAENDSGSFFARIGQQITTGPTHTNVTDVGVALVAR